MTYIRDLRLVCDVCESLPHLRTHASIWDDGDAESNEEEEVVNVHNVKCPDDRFNLLHRSSVHQRVLVRVHSSILLRHESRDPGPELEPERPAIHW